jgi:hypothetical protein
VAKEELGLHEEAKEDFFKSLSLCDQELRDNPNDNLHVLLRGLTQVSLKKFVISYPPSLVLPIFL